MYIFSASPIRQIFDLACACLFEGVLSAKKIDDGSKKEKNF